YGLFRDSVQVCSGLVDLVVCADHHFGGGHRFALVRERFVRLIAEDIAEVGDRRIPARAACAGHVQIDNGLLAPGSVVRGERGRLSGWIDVWTGLVFGQDARDFMIHTCRRETEIWFWLLAYRHFLRREAFRAWVSLRQRGGAIVSRRCAFAALV